MKALAIFALLPLAAVQKPTFEVRGVCAIDAQTVACWAPDGGPKPDLAEEVRRKVAATDRPLAFVPGRKNRFAILRHGPYESLSYAGAYRFVILDPGASEPMSALRIAALPGEATASATLTVGTPHGDPVDVLFRAGAKAVVAGTPVELGPVEGDRPGRWFGNLQSWERWRFPVDLGETTPTSGLRIEPIGRDGKPILFVDEAGRPIDSMRAEALLKEASEARRGEPWRLSGPRVRRVAILVEPGKPLGWAALPVDPKAVKTLRMRRVIQRTETLGPFALDPRP